VTGGGSDILVHFGDEQFLDRYKEFEQHLPEWKAQYPKLASADMRYEGQIVLEMQQGAGVPLNEAAATPSATAASIDAEDTKADVKAAKPAASKASAAKVKSKAPAKKKPVLVKAKTVPKPAFGVSR
jgi:cell division protein FtsQ